MYMILCLIIILQNIYIFTYNYTLKIIFKVKIQSNVKYFLMIIIKTESYSSKSYSSQIV